MKGKLVMSQLITDPTRAARMLATLQNNVSVAEVPDATAEWVFQNPAEAGKEFTLFLQNRARVFIGKIEMMAIDRSKPFDPVEFPSLGKGWSIWKGPADGDGLTGEEEQDPRSLALTELNLTTLQLETTLKGDETSIVGEDKLKRLKATESLIRLDAGIFLTFWNNKHLIPERFKKKTGGNTTYIFCDGTVLRSPHGDRYVLCFCWFGDAWRWDYRRLGRGFGGSDPSALSPQVSPQN